MYFRPEVLVDILRHRHADKYRFANPLPEDARLVRYGVEMERRTNRLCIVVSSAEFEQADDHLLPEWDVRMYEVNKCRCQGTCRCISEK